MIALSEKQRDEADAVCGAILATCARINADLQAAADVIKAETVRCPRCGVHRIAGELSTADRCHIDCPLNPKGGK
jgi:DNA-directed RNA polymerase subunit RPC12/RpoP